MLITASSVEQLQKECSLEYKDDDKTVTIRDKNGNKNKKVPQVLAYTKVWPNFELRKAFCFNSSELDHTDTDGWHL